MNENNTTPELQLHDIKGLVEIPDDSVYYFGGTLLLVVIVLAIAAYLLYRFLTKAKKEDMQKSYLQALKSIDLNNTKVSAYNITHFAGLLEKNEEQSKLFIQLEELLESYKYKKDVLAFDETVKDTYQKFVELF